MAEFNIWHNPEDGTVAKGGRKGDGTYELMRSLGWVWSRTQSGYVIAKSYGKRANEGKINFTVMRLKEKGHTVASVEIVNDGEALMTFEQQEADRDARAADRAERRDELAEKRQGESDAAYERSREIVAGYPMGQPILVGHHSEGRHRRDLDKSWKLHGKSIGLAEAAGHHRNRAEAARNETAHRYNVPTTLRRIEGLEADLRRKTRSLSRCTTEAGRAAVEADIKELTEQIEHWRSTVERAKRDGIKVWGPEDFTPGSFVVVGGDRLYEVLKVNKKSVTVPGSYDYTLGITLKQDGKYTHTVPYHKVTGRYERAEVIAKLAEVGKLPEGVTE